jgi:hypothetical protein
MQSEPCGVRPSTAKAWRCPREPAPQTAAPKPPPLAHRHALDMNFTKEPLPEQPPVERRPTDEEFRRCVRWGFEHGLLSVRPSPEAEALRMAKPAPPPRQPARPDYHPPPKDLSPDLRRAREKACPDEDLG